jgi:hypothetical protein
MREGTSWTQTAEKSLPISLGMTVTAIGTSTNISPVKSSPKLSKLRYTTDKKKDKRGLDKSSLLCYNKGTNEREVIQMAKKNKKKIDRRCFKKEGEELQQYLHFRKRGSVVENKKGKGAYNRQKMKRGDKE